MNAYHKEILALIERNATGGTQHTFLDAYLGNSHKRYAINAPKLRTIAKGVDESPQGYDRHGIRGSANKYGGG